MEGLNQEQAQFTAPWIHQNTFINVLECSEEQASMAVPSIDR